MTDDSSDGSKIKRLGDDQSIFAKSIDKIIKISFSGIFIDYFRNFQISGRQLLEAFRVVDHESGITFPI